MVVDDDASVRALVTAVLEAAGFEVEQAEGVDQAFEHARGKRPDLVISDVQMPGGSGYELCRRLREHCGDLPFMFLSGTRTETFDRVAGLALGADDYVVKPFDPEELVARVRALLRRAPSATASAPPPEGAGPPLTEREREILCLLARGVPHAEIARTLFISPKTVGKHIERLLKKLGVHSRAEAIALAYQSGWIDTSESDR